ncbi:YjiH family protein [Marinococcus sp. PL1-022]|uniref:YjiH family protein n=1 Tax=Marinococcus sp. PL1-022 TaxID=3095363 RepID=UPI0039B43566
MKDDLSRLNPRGEIEETASLSKKNISKFVFPSLLGVFLFMTPLSYDGSVTIPVALLAGVLQGALSTALPFIITAAIALTFVCTVLMKWTQASFVVEGSFFYRLFHVSTPWAVIRGIAVIAAVMTVWEIGPEFIWSENTGGLLMYDLLPILFTVFLFAGLFLPLLLNFGLLELCSAFFTKVMRPLFTLPGRSSIDCLASWLGDGTVGVLLTNKQYEEGYYSEREAAVIGTTFSLVSITFSIVIITYLDLLHMFGPYYFSIVLAGGACALIIPRVPPLSRKSHKLSNGSYQKADEEKPAHLNIFQWGVRKATEKAADTKVFSSIFRGGAKNVLDMWLGVLPVVMAFGVITLIIAEYTPFFNYLGAPFIPLLSLMQVPEAVQAAPTMVIGFADMFLPAVIGSGIESELTRFVIAVVSVSQLIYMSEVGGLLLGSRIPVKMSDLIIIFLQRTVIVLPVAVGMAHLLF